jgi:hypothetical protein
MGTKSKNAGIFASVLGIAAVLVSGGAAAPYIAASYGSWFTAAAVAYGALAARAARKKADRGGTAALEERKQMIASAAYAASVVYGRSPMNGVIAHYRKPVSREDPYVWLILVLPVCHEIEAIDEIRWGTKKVGNLSASGEVIDGEFAPSFTNTATEVGVIPPGNQITVRGLAEDHDETIDLQTPIYASRTPALPQTPAGDEVGNYTPVETVALRVSSNIINIAGNPGDSYTVTYTYRFQRRSIKVWKYLGSKTQAACAEAIAADPTKWTVNHRLAGWPYVVMRIKPDVDIFPNGLENVSFVIRGKKDITDTRTGTVGYTENSILCARDYATNYCNVLAGEINLPLCNAHASACDEGIPIGNVGTEPRYTCNTVLSTEVEPINNLGIIMSSCDGSAVPGPTFDLRCGIYEEPTIILTESDILAGPDVVKGPSRGSGLFNCVSGRAIDPNKDWVLDELPAYNSAYYIGEDNGVRLVDEIDLPATLGVQRGQRLLKQMLFRSRSGLTLKARFNMSAFALSAERTVRLTYRPLGMIEKVFRIKSYEPVSLSEVDMVLQEDGPLVYQWNFNEAAGIDPAPNSSLPNVRIVADIVGLVARSDILTTNFNQTGKFSAQCLVEWNPVSDQLVLNGGAIQARWKFLSSTTWTVIPDMSPYSTSFRFPISRGDIVIIEVRARNKLVVGNWKTIRHSATNAPEAPLGTNQLLNAGLLFSDAGGGPSSEVLIDHWFRPQRQPFAGGTAADLKFQAIRQLGVFGYYQSGIVGIPRIYTGTATTNDLIFITAEPRPAMPGERWLAYVSCGVVPGCQFRVGMVFMDSGGNRIGTADPFSAWIPGFSTPSNIQVPASCFATAPAGTTAVAFRVECQVQLAETVILYMKKPFFGFAAPGQISLPEWTP